MMASPKEINKKAYNECAEIWEEKSKKDFILFEKNLIKFLELLDEESNILDIGCGSGVNMQYCKDLGFQIEGIDISKSMVLLCNEKRLNAKEGDIENLEFPKNSFSAVLASASLLHVPKIKIQEALKDIHEILKPSGILYCSFLKGEGENIYTDKLGKRFFAEYSPQEVEAILSRNFEIIYFDESKIRSGRVFFGYLVRKK